MQGVIRAEEAAVGTLGRGEAGGGDMNGNEGGGVVGSVVGAAVGTAVGAAGGVDVGEEVRILLSRGRK